MRAVYPRARSGGAIGTLFVMVFVKDVLKGAREGTRKGVCNMFIYISYISGLMHICIYIYIYMYIGI